MLNKQNHNLTMSNILKDIYSDTSIAPLLGFKGGTCAYFFYDLPRFSVDLDFDLFNSDENTQKLILEKIVNILSVYGKIKDSYIKRYTIFAMLSYSYTDHNIKVEINTRDFTGHARKYYEIKEHLGTSMLVAKKEYLFSTKLIALTERKELASRDVYDILYFARNNWDIDSEVIKSRTGRSIKEQLANCIKSVETLNENKVLHGLGELVDEKQKTWIKENLKADTIFMLKNYIDSLERK